MPDTETPSLQVKSLSVAYGEFQALKNLNITVQKGELVGVIGPNGAGKTSFIKALCGRVDSTGEIILAGQVLKRGQDRRQKISLVPQDIGLYPRLTVNENLGVISRLLGVKSDMRARGIENALKVIGLTAKANSLVQDLSGGMKRRVNVAAAIMHDPELIIFDEPTAGVDIPARDELHRLARNLAEKGKAVLLVTHELNQAESLCDKILLLSEGQKLAYESPSKILSDQFGSIRTVTIHLFTHPSPKALNVLRSYEFEQEGILGIWTRTGRNNSSDFMDIITGSLGDQLENVKEISIRRPGLTALMHYVESQKSLIR